MYISKRETYMRKIQELGSLPPPAELEKFAHKSISELMKTLDQVNKKLKAYSHVNKKAFDQYVNFNEQRESLLKRKEELDEGAAKVEELIENLDRQKDEAINRTFRDVSKHFKDVFKELVPQGEGELILKTSMDESMQLADEASDDDDEDDDDSETGKKASSGKKKEPDVSLYRGIGIKVRFAASGETYMMNQLSGGQKALVALCIIFSIQRCDPAPFYMFDELDQALDSTYRSAVADLIKKQAASEEHPTQFIVSTFRPELADRAERWFGISHQNKVSNLHELSKKDALHFIANLMNDEEAVGEVTSLATSSRRSLGSRKRKASDGGTSTSAASSSLRSASGRLSAPA
jgi:structural maintenance of chromosome 3 (chondroitin sulfate proteoglycan 6)